MAEFQEVIKYWGRMLDAHRHGESIAIEASVPADAFKDAKLVEEIVMAWAEEHPEPVYETWFEYLLRIGVIPENAPAGSEYQWIAESIRHKHISNDIAESLKLHPKEVQA